MSRGRKDIRVKKDTGNPLNNNEKFRNDALESISKLNALGSKTTLFEMPSALILTLDNNGTKSTFTIWRNNYNDPYFEVLLITNRFLLGDRSPEYRRLVMHGYNKYY